jgi:arylsulfatase A-like enzyme
MPASIPAILDRPSCRHRHNPGSSTRLPRHYKLLHGALVLALLSSATLAAKPPNVIFIVADDLGWADVSFTGMSDVRTPHIDALARNGLRMTRYYGQPVCTPSRAVIHTGRLPLSYGLQTYVISPTGVDYGLDLNETTLPQLLRDRGGYDTHAIGKWHLGEAMWEQTPTFRGYNSFVSRRMQQRGAPSYPSRRL